MAILRVKDKDGNIVEIPAIKGDKGDTGDKGAPGAGVLIGSYTGSGTSEQSVLVDGDVYAMLIINQYCEAGVENNGFTIKGGFVTAANPLKYGSIALAEVTNPVDGLSSLYVRNYTFLAGEEGEYTVGLNESGVTYHYIAFVSE